MNAEQMNVEEVSAKKFSIDWRALLQPELIGSLVVLVVTLTLAAKFYTFNEARQGVVLPDPILKRFAPWDVTWLTFTLIYGGLISGILAMATRPKYLCIGLQTYTLMTILRVGAMYLMPLNPSPQIIVLRDPLVEILATGDPLTKDLFFSGHTASLCIVFFCMRNYWMRRIMFVATLLVAFCVTVQHVHYAVDVYSAPFFAYAAYHIILKLQKKYRGFEEKRAA